MEPGEMRPVLETDPNTGMQIRTLDRPDIIREGDGGALSTVPRINAPASMPPVCRRPPRNGADI